MKTCIRLVRRFLRAEQAYREAVNLAQCLARKHYPDGHPDWKVCDDTTGVIFQISNMTSGMARVDNVKLCEEGGRPRKTPKSAPPSEPANVKDHSPIGAVSALIVHYGNAH